MEGGARGSVLERLANDALAQLAAYYLVLTAVVVLLYQWRPDLPGVFTTGRFAELARTGLGGSAAPPVEHGPAEIALEAIIAMFGALLLMLPVARVYTLTRASKGYAQSLVQTLVVLPIVVAGVVILVKNAVALAFALGGIVGAIAFRHRLQDTKDAVHVFLAIGVGLAAGVQVMAVAAVLSVFYNAVDLVLWWTDFGRVPAGLQGARARRRLAQLEGRAGRTGGVVSQVDDLLLKSMSPEQLAALAQRARKRRRNLAKRIGLALTGERPVPRFDATLRAVTTAEADAVRPVIEAVLAGQVKAWWLEAATAADAGRATLLYKVRLRKSVPAPLVLEAVRRAVAGKVSSIDLT